MIGDQIYIIFRRDIGHSDIMETPHATLDGAYEHMRAIKEHFENKNFDVSEQPDGSFYVCGPYKFKSMYYVATRTIEK